MKKHTFSFSSEGFCISAIFQVSNQIPIISFAFCFIFLFLRIHIVGVTAMATSQERLGPVRLKISNIFPKKLIRNTIRLKKQKVMNPVVRETDSYK